MNICKVFDKSDEDINFPFLMANILRMQKKYIKNATTNFNITKGEFPFLMLLYFKGSKSQKEIADTFIFSEANVAKITRNLEDKNLIKKEIDERNRRKKIVTLTQEGAKICEEIIEIETNWEKEVTKNITQENFTILKETLCEILYESLKI